MPTGLATFADICDRFRSSGRKVTPQRAAVFRVVAGNDQHLTAEAVHAAVVTELPMVSLRTVYQVLNDLVALGELDALDVGTGAVRFDPNLDAHHHLVCTVCGMVRDVDEPLLDGMALPDAALHRFVVDRAELVLRGRCEGCGSG
jgi:Fe2+ or Zn2+ uptake regulation protein